MLRGYGIVRHLGFSDQSVVFVGCDLLLVVVSRCSGDWGFGRVGGGERVII